MTVSQVVGAWVNELQDGIVDTCHGGPLIVECAEHGKFLGLLKSMEEPALDLVETDLAKLRLMMIPLSDGEQAWQL